jgi:hypothetical protein
LCNLGLHCKGVVVLYSSCQQLHLCRTCVCDVVLYVEGNIHVDLQCLLIVLVGTANRELSYSPRVTVTLVSLFS